jgi:hypothetical protein
MPFSIPPRDELADPLAPATLPLFFTRPSFSCEEAEASVVPARSSMT